MGTISAKVVNKSQKLYNCSDCRKLIHPGDSYMRLFGMAHHNDPPYVIKLHISCALPSNCKKITDAIKSWQKE